MEFDCKVNVIDMIMGAGKTSSAINFMNESDDSKKFIYITPYLDEVERIKVSCPDKHFKEPKEIPTKLQGIKNLINKGANIVSTHALFHRFDQECIDICRANNYTLIMDEVADVIQPLDKLIEEEDGKNKSQKLSKQDIETLFDKYLDVEPDTGFIKWREEEEGYEGRFLDIKRMCELNSLAYYGEKVMIWLFPIEVFNSFREIYILTYLFNAQMQRCYYDYFGLDYQYMYVAGDSLDTYHFTDDESKKQAISYDFNSLINIFEDEKLNMIGDRRTDLSLNWFKTNRGNAAMNQLKRNVENFFRKKCNTPSNLNLWTTFKDFESYIKGKGYAKGFVSINMRASNKYKDRVSVAYLANRFMNTGVRNFFVMHGIEVDDEGYAISEMVQFIWRSAIREGEPIKLYMPSIRMRNLLKKWIKENS